MQWGDGIPRDGTSRKMREYQIRFCEKLSVKFTGLTRQLPGSTRSGLPGEVSGDIVERVDPVFFSDPMTAAMKALGMT